MPGSEAVASEREHSLLADTRALAADVLAPAAAEVDRSVVPRSHIDSLGRAGVLGMRGPSSHGGSDCSPATVRAVTEALAGACGSTWFVSTQHHTPVRLLAETQTLELRERWLAALCSGRALAAIAFSHLRRPTSPVTARRQGRGWALTGTAPWVTGWGLADLVVIGAVAEGSGQGSSRGEGEVVFVAVPTTGPTAERHLQASPPLALAAMQATQTVALNLRDLPVAVEDVVLQQPLAHWSAADLQRTIDVNPATFGIATAALASLDTHEDPIAQETGAALAEALAACRAEAYDLSDEAAASGTAAQHTAARRLAVRARAGALCTAATHAFLAASGGRGMASGHPAQRWVREAAFLSVAAQTAPVRSATLRHWAGAGQW